MGNFLVVLPDPDSLQQPSAFERGLRALQALGSPAPVVQQSPWTASALVPRTKELSAETATSSNGDFAFAIGTYFCEGAAAVDAQFLLARYRAVGAEQLGRELNGFFVVVIGDARKKQVLCITDLIGSCFACVRKLPGCTAISGSSLLLSLLAPVAIDRASAQEFLNTGIIYDNRTLYEGIEKLPPASVCRFGEESRRTQYWSAAELKSEKYDADAAAESLWHEIRGAASAVGARYPQIVSDLTGGYDSRLLAAAYMGAGVTPQTTVSGQPGDPDVTVSEGLAAHVGLRHQWLPTSPAPFTPKELSASFQLTDGEYDIFDYTRILRTHRQLAAKYDISTNGSFGEIARGYWWELLLPHIGKRKPLDCDKVVRLRFAPGGTRLKVPGAPDIVASLTEVMQRAVLPLQDAPNTFQMDMAYLTLRMQRWQGRIASSTNRLWPCLSPLMFRGVVETILQSRFASRERSYLVRKLLARYAPRFSEFPLEHGYPAAPLTLKNATQFWPLVPFYTGKVISRLSRMTSLHPDSPLSGGPASSFLESDAAADLMKLENVRSESLFDGDSLPQGDILHRLVTLEFTLSKRTSVSQAASQR